MSVSERERVKALVDLVPEEDLDTVARMLRGLAHDPVAWALEHAPEDDEPVTDEDVAAWEEGKADLAAGRVMSTEELCRRLGI